MSHSNKIQRSKKRISDIKGQLQAYKTLGDKIKVARNKRLFTVSELASIANVNRATIYHIENGKSTVSLFSFFNVLSALGLLEDVKKVIYLDLKGNEIFERKTLIKNAIKAYKL